MRRRTVFALAALAVATVPGLHAAGPQFWRLEGARTFLEGDIEGLSLDSDGRLRLGASPRPLFDPEAPNAWCVARDARGVLYVGTGNDGRVLRVDGTKGSVLFDAEELEVHAVAVGPDGRVYAATSPHGAVYAIDAAGKATRFFDPEETYVWALAFDRAGALYVATGGEGRVYRVSPDGKAETVLASTETHILSLATDARGSAYAGSAPEGLVYRIESTG
jgi:sugar lactone lactonase YvrE